MHYGYMVHLVMFSWPLICLWAFRVLPARRAVCLLCVLGYCFLPEMVYEMPGPVKYGKETAISLGILFCLFLRDRNAWHGLRWSWVDLPVAIWCCVSVCSSLSNDLGLYDGVAVSLSKVSTWGALYLTGRAVFRKLSDFTDLLEAIVIGGLCYVPFYLFEMRMSPYLNQLIYGFTTEHLFQENFRYGGWRPCVFLNHGITTAMFMGTATMCAIILYGFGKRRHVLGMPMGAALLILFPLFIFCRSGGAWITVLLMLGVLVAATAGRRAWPFAIVLSVIPAYILSRILDKVDLSWASDLLRPNVLRVMWSASLVFCMVILACLDRREKPLRLTFAVVPIGITLAFLLLPLNNSWLFVAGPVALVGVAIAARGWWPVVFMLIAMPTYHLDLAYIAQGTNASLGSDRAGSLMARVTNENVMMKHILEQPIFGWGTGLRFMPVGPDATYVAIDSFWPVPLGMNGAVGMIAVYALIVGIPALLAMNYRRPADEHGQNDSWAGLMGALACMTSGALYTLSAGYAFPMYPLLLGGAASLIATKFELQRKKIELPFNKREYIPNRVSELGLAEAVI